MPLNLSPKPEEEVPVPAVTAVPPYPGSLELEVQGLVLAYRDKL
jgi:hypothetical protein